MPTISEKLEPLMEVVKVEEEKLRGGTKKAAASLRKALMEIKNIALEGRKEAMVLKENISKE